MKCICEKTWGKINFLEETIECLKEEDKNTSDVLWVGNRESKMSWENFTRIADFIYDNGFGCNQIAMDLMVVGKDWWFERREYDGAENWVFQTYPTKPNHIDNRLNIFCNDCKNPDRLCSECGGENK